ncbi:tetratricopeptide repeat protein [Stenotrophomonas sp. SY1]|uniref:tetratricopeptide repeat protein n=1 Tax=Stenotrophomonas sp. SY1 TaxID=477235 RepID=UPI001E440D01|nr:tetratricopeptide repeat protein [Stenotrophomonas sp. SY1]MCD9087991.1 VWA domain-containing protein [Stenotrophomonas sp. SY1]
MNLWQQLHFLRPEWLWALLLVPAALLGSWYRRRRRTRWHEAVDPHLLPHLLAGSGKHGWLGSAALVLGLLLAVLALAGPSWRQLEQPLWEAKTPLVVVLDLSNSIRATDLPPSRLLQARSKLATLLRERKGGEVALVAFAWEPFTVAPLTDDTANVALFLDALSPEIMPVDGHKPDKALAWAGELLKQSGARQGQVLLMTDHSDAAALAAAAQLRAGGYQVSALGLGTLQGAAYRDARGAIAHAHLDEGSLRALAVAGGGRYQRIASTDADLRALDVLEPLAQATKNAQDKTGKAWLDEGYWLLPPVLLLALLAFRRPRRVLPVVALCLLLPMMQPAHAAEPGGWWQRADQREHQRLAEGVDAYRRGDFAAAQQRFEGIQSDQGRYNLGNALARQGKYDEAIAAYDQALKLQPGMPDALANRAAVDAARKRDKSQGQQQGQKGDAKQNSSDSQQGQGANDPAAQQGQQGQQSQQSQQGQAQDQQPSPASKQPGKDEPSSPRSGQQKPETEDAGKQQQADQAQRQRMEQAMRQQQAQADQNKAQKDAARAAMTPQQREQQQAVDAWMQRVPDEPGNLLKAKFQLEYERRMREGR